MLARLVALWNRLRRRQVMAEASRDAGAWVAIYTREVARLHLEHGGYSNRSPYCPVCTSRVRYAGDGQLRPRA